MDEDPGVPVLVGWRAVSGQEPNCPVVRIVRRLIVGDQPVSMSSIAARKKTERRRCVAVFCQRRRRDHEERHRDEYGCGREPQPCRSLSLHCRLRSWKLLAVTSQRASPRLSGEGRRRDVATRVALVRDVYTNGTLPMRERCLTRRTRATRLVYSPRETRGCI